MQVGPELEIPGYGCEDHFLEQDTTEHSWECIAVSSHPECAVSGRRGLHGGRHGSMHGGMGRQVQDCFSKAGCYTVSMKVTFPLSPQY